MGATKLVSRMRGPMSRGWSWERVGASGSLGSLDRAGRTGLLAGKDSRVGVGVGL